MRSPVQSNPDFDPRTTYLRAAGIVGLSTCLGLSIIYSSPLAVTIAITTTIGALAGIDVARIMKRFFDSSGNTNSKSVC